MISGRLVVGLFVTAASAFLIRCDTADNMESPLAKYFVKYMGGDGRQWGVDMAVDIIGSDTDGSPAGTVYMLGNTTSSGNGQQLYVARITTSGIVEWERRLGNINDDFAKDIELLSDRRLAILGTVTDAGGRKDFILRLLDVSGNMIDSVTYGSPTFDEEAISISETTDSYIVTGYTDNVTAVGDPAQAFYLRFYKDLTIYSNSWTVRGGLDGDFDVGVKTLEVTQSTGPSLYYVFGYSNSTKFTPGDAVPDYNVFVWLVNDTGVPQNDFRIENSEFPNSNPAVVADEILSSVSISPPQSGAGFLLTGYSVNTSRNEQVIFAMKIRRDLAGISNAAELLQVPPRSDSSSLSSISTSRTSIFPSQGSGFFVLGTQSNGGNEDIYLKKLQSNLSDGWTSPPSFLFGGIGKDEPGAVLETIDGRIMVLGTMVLGEVNGQEKIVLIKLSPSGKLGE